MGCVYQRGRVWWIKYQDANRDTQYRSTKAATKAEARKLLQEKEVVVNRQELGLAPLALNPESWTLAQLMQWWLDTYSVHMPAHRRNIGTVRRHIIESTLGNRLVERVSKGDIEAFLQSKQGDLAPQTINHIREFIVRAFNKAAEADKWFGDNPAEQVKLRKIPDPHHDILSLEEVVPFFAALAPEQRPIFAAAIFTGLRKGELCGLLKTDVDLAGRRITVCRSYERPWPKGRKTRIVRIATELVPFIEYALEALPGPWLLPDGQGRMHTPYWKPEKLLRTALRRAGIVTGFLHVCRRKGCERPARLPELRDEAMAAGEESAASLPRAAPYFRQHVDHVRGEPGVRTEAPRALEPEDHRRHLRASRAGLLAVGSELAALWRRPARTDCEDFATHGIGEHDASYTGVTVERRTGRGAW